MPVQTSGAISWSDFASEFNDAAPHSLSEFYGNASGVTSGNAISASNLYGATDGSATAYNLLYEAREFDANGNSVGTTTYQYYYPKTGVWLGSTFMRSSAPRYIQGQQNGTTQHWHLQVGSAAQSPYIYSGSAWELLGLEGWADPSGFGIDVYMAHASNSGALYTNSGWTNMNISGTDTSSWNGVTHGSVSETLTRTSASFTSSVFSSYPRQVARWSWTTNTSGQSTAVGKIQAVLQDAQAIAQQGGSSYTSGQHGTGKSFNMTFS